MITELFTLRERERGKDGFQMRDGIPSARVTPLPFFWGKNKVLLHSSSERERERERERGEEGRECQGEPRQ